MCNEDDLITFGIDSDNMKRLEALAGNIIPTGAANAIREERMVKEEIVLVEKEKERINVQADIQKNMNITDSTMSKSIVGNRMSRIKQLLDKEENKDMHADIRDFGSGGSAILPRIITDKINKKVEGYLHTILNGLHLFEPGISGNFKQTSNKEVAIEIICKTNHEINPDKTLNKGYKIESFLSSEFRLNFMKMIITETLLYTGSTKSELYVTMVNELHSEMGDAE